MGQVRGIRTAAERGNQEGFFNITQGWHGRNSPGGKRGGHDHERKKDQEDNREQS